MRGTTGDRDPRVLLPRQLGDEAAVDATLRTVDDMVAASNKLEAERRAREYAPPAQRQSPVLMPLPSTKEHLAELESLLNRGPIYGASITLTDLKFHELMTLGAGIVAAAEDEALKKVPPHELAKAVSAWGMSVRTKTEPPT
jgi:hypothetical protein